eukprot:PhM_4_TR4578/c0_g1_i1/m.55213
MLRNVRRFFFGPTTAHHQKGGGDDGITMTPFDDDETGGVPHTYEDVFPAATRQPDGTSAEEPNLTCRRHLRTPHLVALAFVFTCAGPFGVEAAVRTGGPGLAFLGVLVTPIVFVLPQVVMVAELATMMPSNHGYVMWVKRALGPFAGFMTAFSSIIANAFDMTVYAAMFSSYLFLKYRPGTAFVWQYIVRVACIAIATALALLESKNVAAVSGAIGVLIMVPFLVGFFAALPQVDPRAQWFGGRADGKPVDWSVLGGTLCWLYTGWNAMGNLASEVAAPRVYSVGMGIAVVLDVAAYVLPMIAALTVSIGSVPDKSTFWDDGFLSVAMGEVLSGLGDIVAVAAAISCFGMLTNSIVCYSRAVAGVADFGWLPAIFARTRPGSAVPYVSTLAFAVVMSVLAMYDFDFLIQVDTVLAAESYVLTFVSFVRLRYSEPDAPRPYRVPGGLFGAWATTLIKVVVMAALTIVTCVQEPIIFVAWVGVNIVGAVVYRARVAQSQSQE